MILLSHKTKVDLVRVDLAAIDLVRIDLVKGSLHNKAARGVSSLKTSSLYKYHDNYNCVYIILSLCLLVLFAVCVSVLQRSSV